MIITSNTMLMCVFIHPEGKKQIYHINSIVQTCLLYILQNTDVLRIEELYKFFNFTSLSQAGTSFNFN